MIDTEDTDVRTKRNQLTIMGIILALVGLGFSLYTVAHHLALKGGGGGDFACNINQTFNCDAVAMSSYSELMGIPLGIWGAGYFLGLALILLVGKFVPKNEEDCWQGYAALVVLGFVVSVVLAIISTTVIGAVCLACTGIYGVCLLQAGLLAILRRALPWPMTAGSISNGALVALVGVVAVVVAFQFVGPQFSRVANQDLPMQPDGTRTSLLPMEHDIPIDKSRYSGFGEDFRKGPDSAKVKIVEFADFECPACGDTASVLTQLKSEFGDKIQVIFKNYPLDRACNSSLNTQIHEHACAAAKYARCAGEFDKFWEFHDLLFKNQRDFSEMAFRTWALGLGISEAGLTQCLNSSDLVAKIENDIEVGNKVGVNGTPTLFINGRQFVGARTVETLTMEINRLLNQ